MVFQESRYSVKWCPLMVAGDLGIPACDEIDLSPLPMVVGMGGRGRVAWPALGWELGIEGCSAAVELLFRENTELFLSRRLPKKPPALSLELTGGENPVVGVDDRGRVAVAVAATLAACPAVSFARSLSIIESLLVFSSSRAFRAFRSPTRSWLGSAQSTSNIFWTLAALAR